MVSIIEQNKEQLKNLCSRYHVSVLELFGSAATDDFDDKTSDLDFLVVFDDSVKENRFDNFFSFLDELRKIFNRPVDLVEEGGLKNPYLIRRINQTRRKIYGSS